MIKIGSGRAARRGMVGVAVLSALAVTPGLAHAARPAQEVAVTVEPGGGDGLLGSGLGLLSGPTGGSGRLSINSSICRRSPDSANANRSTLVGNSRTNGPPGP